jgi:hypothetical protein
MGTTAFVDQLGQVVDDFRDAKEQVATLKRHLKDAVRISAYLS